MKRILSFLFRKLFRRYDQLWRRWHRVYPVDDLLSLSLETYIGEPHTLPNGVTVNSGDRLGVLHFNHGAFVGASEGDPGNLRGALHFRRQLFASLRHLAATVEVNPAFAEIDMFHGVTWLRAHGEKIGFVIEPLPDTLATRLKAMHFRLLLRAFFPALARRENQRLHPHAFWMSRRELLTNFSHGPGEMSKLA